jgi:hypothetical protein
MAGVVTNTSLGGVGLQFLAFNSVIFAVGVFMAFFRHDPDANYEPALLRRDRLRQRLSEQEALYGRRRDALSKSHASALEEINRQIADTEKRLDQATSNREGVEQRVDPDLLVIARGIVHRAQVQVGAYYRRAGTTSVVLPEYVLPSDTEVVARIKASAQSQFAQATQFTGATGNGDAASSNRPETLQ